MIIPPHTPYCKTDLILMAVTKENLQWAWRHYPQYHDTAKAHKRSQQYLLGRALLHEMLGLLYPELNLSKESMLSLGYQAKGKPFLQHFPYLHFNLSHNDQVVALFISQSGPVGIDIEIIQERRSFTKLLSRIFTPTEILWIKNAADFKQAFFLLWSAKEAYLKAEGGGLAHLKYLEVDILQGLMKGPLSSQSLSHQNLSANQGGHYQEESSLEPFMLWLTLLPNFSSFSSQTLALMAPKKSLENLEVMKFTASHIIPYTLDWDYTLLEATPH